MVALTVFVRFTKTGKAMRAVAQNPTASQLMGIDINRVIGVTFVMGGALGGAASVVYALYNNTIRFDLGYRAGMDAFTAAVLGGIGSLPGAMLGGLLIGVIRSMSDQYIAARWRFSHYLRRRPALRARMRRRHRVDRLTSRRRLCLV